MALKNACFCRVGHGLAVLVLFVLFPRGTAAQGPTYFVTYTHHMEEPGSLEVSLNGVAGAPAHANGFIAIPVEFEYGVKGWWTTEVYLDGQTTTHDSTIFTGTRWENRFRPLLGEHWINPVLYFEFASINGADKTLREFVGIDEKQDQSAPNWIARHEHKRELELKLILSSQLRGWNISENFIAEKNLAAFPWEFGYAAGISRPLALAASPRECRLCRENFSAGIEFYGGAGTTHLLTFSGTSHYLAPVLEWQVSGATTLRVSPAWGITPASHRFLLRFGVSYEFPGFGRRAHRSFQ